MRKLILSILVCFTISFISFSVHAESIFLEMPIGKDGLYTIEKFQTRYEAITGEAITVLPTKNDLETHYLIGSSRLTADHVTQLKAEFPMVIISKSGEYPVTWTTKDPPGWD